MAAALLGVDHQRAVLLEDRRVGVPHQVGPQRLIRRLPVGGLDDQRARLPVVVERAARRHRGRRRGAAATAARASSRAAAAGTPRRAGTRAPRRRSAPRSPPPRSAPRRRRRTAPRPAGGSGRRPRTTPRCRSASQRDRQVDLGHERAQLAQMRLVPVQVRPPRRRRLRARVEQRLAPARRSARPGRRGTPATARSRPRPRTRTAPAAEPVALVRRRQERIGHRVHAEQRRPRVAVADEDVLVRVAQREPAHGRTSSTSPPHSTTDCGPRHRPGPRCATSRPPPSDSRTGASNVTRAGPRTRPRRSCAPSPSQRTRELAVPRHRLALERHHPAAAAPPRPQPQPQPVPREAMRRAAVRRRLRAEHRDRQRHHHEPQRRRHARRPARRRRAARQREHRRAARRRSSRPRAAARRPAPAAPTGRRGRSAGRPRTRAGRSGSPSLAISPVIVCQMSRTMPAMSFGAITNPPTSIAATMNTARSAKRRLSRNTSATSAGDPDVQALRPAAEQMRRRSHRPARRHPPHTPAPISSHAHSTVIAVPNRTLRITLTLPSGSLIDCRHVPAVPAHQPQPVAQRVHRRRSPRSRARTVASTVRSRPPPAPRAASDATPTSSRPGAERGDPHARRHQVLERARVPGQERARRTASAHPRSPPAPTPAAARARRRLDRRARRAAPRTTADPTPPARRARRAPPAPSDTASLARRRPRPRPSPGRAARPARTDRRRHDRTTVWRSRVARRTPARSSSPAPAPRTPAPPAPTHPACLGE